MDVALMIIKGLGVRVGLVVLFLAGWVADVVGQILRTYQNDCLAGHVILSVKLHCYAYQRTSSCLMTRLANYCQFTSNYDIGPKNETFYGLLAGCSYLEVHFNGV